MKSKYKLPLIEKKAIKDYMAKSQNSFHFYLRFEKPLKIGEPTKKYLDNSITLTKLQKYKLKSLKMKMKQIQKENLKRYLNSTSDINRYKNMLPLKIWDKCEQMYDKSKLKYNSLNKKIKKNGKPNLYFKRNFSVTNISNSINLKNKFENQGLNDFIENIEKFDISNINNVTNSFLIKK